MAVDMFLKIGDHKGESKQDGHKDEIDVLAWSWGMNQSGTMHVGGGGGAGKVSINDISITKWFDNSSAALMTACCTGEHIKDAVLTVRKAGGSQLEYLIITMDNVLVSSISTGGSGGEDRLTENLVLNFEKFEVKYTPQDEKGAEGTPQIATWDISAGKKK